MTGPKPTCDKGNHRKPKQKVKVGPKDSPIYMLRRLEKVMVVVPVNADKHKAENIAEQSGNDGEQRLEFRANRRLQIEHHNGDDDRNDPVTKRFQPAF